MTLLASSRDAGRAQGIVLLGELSAVAACVAALLPCRGGDQAGTLSDLTSADYK
jgi:hypothetical protein